MTVAAMRRVVIAFAVLLGGIAPALAQTRALPPGEIRSNGDITFGNALKLGKREGNRTVITPDTLQILGPGSTGDTSAMSLSAPSSGLTRSLAERATDQISILDYGAKGDWTDGTGTATDATPALNKALALSVNRCIFFPPGNYFFAATPATVTNKPVCLVGAGPQVTRFIFGPNTTNGLTINQNDITNSVVVRDISFMTMTQEAGDALTVTWSDADALLIPGSPHGRFEGLHFSGYLFNVSKYGWRRGINFTNAVYPTIKDIFCHGRTSATGPNGTQVIADIQHQTDCILLQAGAFDIVAGFLNNIRAYNVVNGIRMFAPATSPGAGMEGLNVTQYDCAGCGYGVKVDVAVGSVGVTVADGHLNVLHAGIAGNIGPDAQISNLLIYKVPLANVATYCLNLNGALNASIANINCKNQTTDAAVSGDFYGIRLGNASSAHLSNIYIERPTAGIVIDNGTPIASVPAGATGGVTGRNVVTAGTFANATGGSKAVADSTGNASNRISGGAYYQAKTNASASAPDGNGTYPVSLDTLQVLAGQQYRVTAQVAMTNGGAAGDMVTTILKTAGTATASFGPSGGQLNQRQQIGANQSAIQNFSGVVIITGTGTLNLSVLVQSTGSTGSIPVNGAMLTVEGL